MSKPTVFFFSQLEITVSFTTGIAASCAKKLDEKKAHDIKIINVNKNLPY